MVGKGPEKGRKGPKSGPNCAEGGEIEQLRRESDLSSDQEQPKRSLISNSLAVISCKHGYYNTRPRPVSRPKCARAGTFGPYASPLQRP